MHHWCLTFTIDCLCKPRNSSKKQVFFSLCFNFIKQISQRNALQVLFSTVSIMLGECSWNPRPRLQSHCVWKFIWLWWKLWTKYSQPAEVPAAVEEVSKMVQSSAQATWFVLCRTGRECPWNFAEETDPGLSTWVWTPLETGDWKMCSIVPEHSELASLDLYSSLVNRAAGKAKMLFVDSSGRNIPKILSVYPSLCYTIFFSVQPDAHSFMQISHSRRRNCWFSYAKHCY